ncbi:Efflux pump periplasmic linker BepF [Planctomyces sp. SH-PL14]|nr:Efflux pump periplasmic linker BepF [Planctomyces sp. SH-PL14]
MTFSQPVSPPRTATRLLALALAFAAPTLSGCQRTAAPTESTAAAGELPPIRVVPIRPARKTLRRIVELPGRVEAYEVAPLHAKVTGYVESIPVDIGDSVAGPKGDGPTATPGAELCRLLVPELREELAQKAALVGQAVAEVAQAEAAVKVAEAGLQSAHARVQEAEATVAREEATYKRWVSEFERITQLVESGAVTRKVLEETKAQLDAAAAGRQEVTARIASVQALAREAVAGLEKARADLTATLSRQKVAEAEQRRLEAMVGYSVVRAPFDGVIVERNVHTGHLVRTGGGSGAGDRPLLTIMKIDPVRVFVDVPEGDAVYVDAGTKATIKVPSLAGDPLAAPVTRTSWSLNATSRTLTAEIDVANASKRLRPGLYVQVALTVAELEDVLSLPRTAIFTQDKRTCCYTIGADGKVVLTPVTLGLQAGNELEVRSGLTGDEQVIGANTSAFRPGLPVEIGKP